MTPHELFAGRIVQGVDLAWEGSQVVAKVTFIGTDHYLVFRSREPEKVCIEAHDGK